MQSADIILVRGIAWYDKAIEIFTQNPFSHAALLDGSGNIIEAIPAGVTKSPANKWGDLATTFICPELTDEKRRKIVSIANSLVGDVYGWSDILKDIGINVPIYRKHFDCSVLVAYCYNQVGIRLTCAPCPTPGDLSYSPLLEGNRDWKYVY